MDAHMKTSGTVYHYCSLVSKCLCCTAPSYLTDLCIPASAVTARCCLRSSSHSDLMIPCSRLSRYGSHSFAVCGPAAWNSLPAAVRDLSSSSSCFSSDLKTEQFSRVHGVNSLSLQQVCDCFAVRTGEHKLSFLLTYLPWNVPFSALAGDIMGLCHGFHGPKHSHRHIMLVA